MWLSCPAVTVTHALKRADLLQFAEKTGHQYTCTGVDVGNRPSACGFLVGGLEAPAEREVQIDALCELLALHLQPRRKRTVQR